MSKAFHISDPHLTFDENGVVLKPMHLRKWALGAWTYQDYIPAMEKFAAQHISDSDITFITGDIVHNLKAQRAQHSIRWLRKTIRGTLVICRGNHDVDWTVPNMRDVVADLHQVHILNEGDITSLGKFTIGCFSNHSIQTKDFDSSDGRYLETAINTVKQAKDAYKIPIMIGHYPVNPNMAAMMGNAGIKAYMSGHVHCTSTNEPGNVDGINWHWYNILCKLTDDQIINDCFFSTGTTDVLRAKHGQSFKEITHLATAKPMHPDQDGTRYVMEETSIEE